MELLPQTENIFLVYKEGWHNPETHPENPSVERTWSKKDALAHLIWLMASMGGLR